MTLFKANKDRLQKAACAKPRLLLGRCLLATLLLASTAAQALDLIQPRLVKTNDQTTLIHIAIIDSHDIPRESLTIDLASAEDVKQADLTLSKNSEALLTDIVLDDSGASFVKVWTNKPLSSDTLQFTLRANWISGSILRQFTVSLADDAASSFTQATQTSPSINTEQTPATIQRPAETEATADLTNSTLQAFNKRKAGVTLWHVASIIQQNEDATTNQVMLAFLRKNPRAFINNNINHLKKGSVLRAPNSEEIHETTARDARREINDQGKRWTDWKNGKRAQLDGRKTGNTPLANKADGLLRLSNGEKALPSPGLQSVLTELKEQQQNYQQLLNKALNTATADNTGKQSLSNDFGKINLLVADLKQTVELKNAMLAYMQTRRKDTTIAELPKLPSADLMLSAEQSNGKQASLAGASQLERKQQQLNDLSKQLDGVGSSNIRLVIFSAVAILLAFVLIGSGLIMMFRRQQLKLADESANASLITNQNAEMKAKPILRDLFEDDTQPLEQTLHSLRKLLEKNEGVFAQQSKDDSAIPQGRNAEQNKEFDPFDAMDFDNEFALIDQMFVDVAEPSTKDNTDLDDSSDIIWQPALSDSSSASWQVKTLTDKDSAITEVDGTTDLLNVPATPIELARAYLELDDHDGARKMLAIVIEQGSESEQTAAKELLEGIS